MRHAHVPVTDDVRRRALRRLNRFLVGSSAPSLLKAVSWTTDPTKEITESLAVIEPALRWAEPRGLRGRNLQALVVGDGTTPRTGALLASLTAWSVTSVDPMMKEKHYGIPRLTAVKGHAREVEGLFDVVLAPHSHAPVRRTRARAKPGGLVVALPCCVDWAPANYPTVYVDDACLSPARTVIVEGGWLFDTTKKES